MKMNTVGLPMAGLWAGMAACAVLTGSAVAGELTLVQDGNDIVAYRQQYPTLGILGGLDKSALAKGKPEMHRELDRAERVLTLGGWVPGFDHMIPPDVPWGNYTYFMEHLRKMVFRT